MFRTKAEVDRHVSAKSAKLTDRERTSRSYSFAQLYYGVGDYETCRRYLTNYLSSTENNAAAHTLLGNALLKLGQKEKALEEYKASYELDPSQRNLLVTVCELLTDHEVVMEVSRAKYWCKLAEAINPHHPAIFQLKERIMSSSGADPESMERLLEMEIKMRPDDVVLHARYLRQMLTANKAGEAFARSLQLELDRGEKFRNNFVWYETLLDVINHNKLQSTPNNWEHNLLRLIVLDRICTLSLLESTANTRKSMSECSTALHNLDQALFTARSIQGLPELVKEFLVFFRAQLCFHAACYLLKKAKREISIWRDAVKSATPLLSVAFHARPPDEKPSWLSRAPDHVRSLLLRWSREASYRCSQAGHVLLGCVKENRRQLLVDQINQTCANSQWKHKIYEELFPNKEELAKIKTSYLVQVVENLDTRLPRLPELNSYDETAQLMYADSLHHFVWLGLNKNLTDFHCNAFGGLQKSVQNISNCSPETLSQIDVDAFLYCTILTTQQKMSAHDLIDYKNNDKPSFLPADITELLCSVTQMKWWECAYRLNLDRYLQDVADARSLLMRGIEVIRCIGDHGLPPSLLCILGSIFSDRANAIKNDKDSLEDRAARYYAAALPLLEEAKFKSSSQYLHKKMFDYIIKDLSPHEIDSLLEEAKLFLGVRHMNDGEHEKAVALLSTVKSPYGSYHLFHIYKRLSDEQISINKENVTSEMRSKCITLLSKAKQAAYTTMDRIKSIANPPKKHPLYTDVYEQLQNIEVKLCRIDPDVSNNRNDCDGKYFSDDDSSKGSLSEHIGSIALPHMNSSMYVNASSTPKHRERSDQTSIAYRSIMESNYSSKRDHRLTSDRLDAQIKQLHKKESVMLNFIDQTKEWLDTNRDLAVEVREMKKTINDLKTSNTNLELAVEVREMKKTISDLKAINLQDTVDHFKTLKISIDQIRDRMTEHRDESKTEIKELRKEMNDLKNGISKVKSGQPANSEHEDVYIIDDEYQSNDNTQTFTNPTPQVPFPQPHNILPGFSQRMGIPPVPLPPTAPYHPMYLQNPLFLYNQYSQLAQAGGHPIFDSSRPHIFPGTTNLFPPEQSIFPDISQLLGPANLPGPVMSQTSHSSVPAPVSNIRPILTPQPILKQKPVLISEPTKPLPLNVVITSSDPLPTRVSAPQPMLSVTIPPEHIKGNTPHNYQIQMPITTVKSSISTPLSSVNTPKFGSNITSDTLFGTPKLSTPNGNSIFGTPTNLSGFFDTPKNKDLSNTSFNADKSRTLSEKSNVSLEYDPCPNFKPIIALPDEVELTTGEENETVLFKARAHLFRFQDKQWKDRGVGDVKLLKNNKNGKVRILMRREQVHKICANHIITADMELKPVKNEDRAYFWVANDFADEVLVLEKFTIRFKTSDIAKDFYEVFNKARKEASEESVITNNSKTMLSSNKIESAPLSLDKFKPVLGSWSCNSCYVNNDSTKNVCEACKTKKLTIEAPQTTTFSFSSDTKEKKILGGLTFSSTPTFQIASNTATVEAKKPEVPKVNPFAAFSFSAVKGPVSQSQSTTTIPQKPEEKNSLNMSSTSDQGDEFVPTAEFKPVVPLPSLVKVQTGEENEKVLFEHRAKLYRYDTSTKEWKERGLGTMKLLRNAETNKLRLLMRREQILKVCCNHFITPEVVFKNKGDNALTWYAQDFAENEVTTEFFSIKFKNASICEDFLNAIEMARVDNTQISTTVKDNKFPNLESKGGFGDQFKPKAGSWNCSTCCVNNVSTATLCVSCSTKREPEKKNQNIIPKYEVKSSEGFGDKFKPKPDAWMCSECYISNEANAMRCVACGCSNPRGGDTIQSAAKEEPYWVCCCKTKNDNSRSTCIVCNAVKGSTLVAAMPKFSFGIPTTNVQSNQASFLGEPIKKSGQASTFSFGIHQTVAANKSTDAEVKSPFSWKPEAKPSEVKALFSFAQSESANNPPALQPWNVIEEISNAGLVTPTKKEDGSVSFAVNRTGKFEFHLKPKSPGKSPKSEKGEEDSDNEYAFEDDGDHIHFTPIIPLPDKVEVVTGEENEDVLSCHRAKLYRFVTDEFKERGIGDVKILRHKVNRKLRVVMRREQVLKICLNHALTKDTNYTRKDERSWLFYAHDFSEGQLMPQQFCLRFKTKDIAEDFRNAADKARSDSTGAAVGDDDLQIITEVKADTKDIEAARRLLLPDNFYLYKEKEKCVGCRGCDDNFIFPTVDMAELDRIHGAQTTTEPAESKESSIPKDDLNTPFSTPCKSAMFSDANSSNVTSVKSQGLELFSTPQGIFGSTPNLNPFTNSFAFKNAESQVAESKLTDQPPLFGLNANLFSTKNNKTGFDTLGSNSTSVFGAGNNSPFSQSNDNKINFSLPPSKLEKSPASLSTENSKPVVSLFGQMKSDTKPTANIFDNLVSKESDKKSEDSKSFGLSFNESIFAKKFDGDKSPFTYNHSHPVEKADLISVFPLAKPIFGQSSNEKPKDSEGPKEPVKLIFGCPVTPKPISESIFGQPKVETITSVATAFGAKDSILSPNVFGTKPDAQTTLDNFKIATPATTIFGKNATVNGNLFSQSQNTGLFGTQFVSKPADSQLVNTKIDTKTLTSDKPIFNLDNTLTFTSLAASSNTTDFTKCADFTWEGAGQKLFTAAQIAKADAGNKKKINERNEKGSDAESGDDAKAEDYNEPHFEPIVPLPDKIVISTGEENEEVIFAERGKLYRYDGDVKQWKERGVGNVKLLHHTERKSYRLLLRREQVHKAVLNQLVTSDLEMLPMLNSANAWTWAGRNHAESDIGIIEKLAVRFKSKDTATIFKDKVDSAIQSLSVPTPRSEPLSPSNVTIIAAEHAEDSPSSDIVNVAAIENAEEDYYVVQNDDEHGQEEYDDYDNEDTDEGSIMCSMKCNVDYVGEDLSVADANIQVVYEGDLFLGKILITDNDGLVHTNMLILQEYDIRINGMVCEFQAMDSASPDGSFYPITPERSRTLRVTFESEDDALIFHSNFLECVSYVRESHVTDIEAEED